MDCMRLFTKEDVLDGDEKPVGRLKNQRSLLIISTMFYFEKLPPHLDVSLSLN